MGPKKDTKPQNTKEIDPSIYIRKVLETNEAPVDRSLVEPLTGKIANVECLFAAWGKSGVSDEKWNDLSTISSQKPIVYPKNLQVCEEVKLLKYLNLEPIEVAVDPKAKKDTKKDAKKGQAVVDAPVDLTEKYMDEHGRTLPVIFRGSGLDPLEHEKFDVLKGFQLDYTAEQVAIKQEQDDMRRRITSGSSTSLADLQSMLQQSLDIRNMETEAPVGEEVDPLLCQTYRLLSVFGLGVHRAVREYWGGADGENAATAAAADHVDNFLWRAIYPKLPDGKPVYNPFGKYCVRLYLAGCWRKVYVDDNVPVRRDGRSAVAGSEDKYELWPLVLSKAIYRVYCACGYAEVFSDPLDATLSTPTVNQRVVQFSSFAIHLLTGWNPTAPVNVSQTFLFEHSRSKMLLKAVLSDGVCEVHENDIVRDHDELNSLERYKSFRITRTQLIPEGSMYANDDSDEDEVESLEPVGQDPMMSIKEDSVGSLSSEEQLLSPGHDYIPPDGEEDGLVLRTKRQFKFEYKKRKNHRDKVIDSILTRERKIVKTNTALAAEQSSINFIGYVDKDKQRIRILPVLGVSYPIYRRDNLLMVLLLVRWRVGAPNPTPFSPNPNPDDPFYGKIRGEDEGPLPLTTPLDYEWISIHQLVSSGAFMISMDTNMYTNRETDFSSHWVSATPAAVPPAVTEKAGKGEKSSKASKAAKEVVVEANPVVVDEFFAEPGSIPITLFKLNVNEFFVPVEERNTNRKSSIRVTQTLEKSVDGIHETVNPLVPRHQYLHFTLAVHLDAVVQYKESSNESRKQSPIPGNTVVVLQEFRTDNAEPLCFLMELKSDSYIPIISKTFGISQKQLLQRDPSKPIVFWMRLFSSASVYIKFCSEVSMTVGPAEAIWSEMGKKIFVKDGVCPDVPDQTQQLIFRLPLVAVAANDQKDPTTDSSVPAVAAPTHVAAVFLHIKESLIESIISTGVVPNVSDSDSFAPFARNQGNIVQLSEDPTEAPVLIGRAYPSRDLKAGIPSFKWKLLILSDIQVKEPAKSIHEEKVTQKYSGKYIANNENLLFRDVFSFERASFPIAFRLLSKKNRTVEARGAQQQTQLMKQLTQNKKIQNALKNALMLPRRTEVSLIVRTYRLSDNKLVGEYKGGETVLCYFQDLKSFLPDGESEPSGGATAVPLKKDAKVAGKGPAKGGITVPETVDILIECFLDESRMQLPMHWQSRFPHVFDDLIPSSDGSEDSASNSLNSIEAQSKCLNVKPPVDMLMSWKMEILAGKVTNVSHDTRRLIEQAAVKNSWETSSVGRAERAVAALAFYQEYSARSAGAVLASNGSEEEKKQSDLSTSMLTNLVVALQSEEDLLNRRYEQQYNLPKVEGIIEVIDESLIALLMHTESEGAITNVDELTVLNEEHKKPWTEEKDFADSRFQDLANNFAQLNNSLKDEVRERVNFIIKEAVGDATELAKLWELREKYRLWVDSQNSSLGSLLKRAAAAQQTAKAAEKKAADEAAVLAEKLRKEEEKKAAKKK